MKFKNGARDEELSVVLVGAAEREGAAVGALHGAEKSEFVALGREELSAVLKNQSLSLWGGRSSPWC